MSLYLETVRSLVAEGLLDPAAPTLVVAGGTTDRQIMLDAGFTNVTISNLDSRMTGPEFAPYGWMFLDAENLNVELGRFDQIIEHLGLHHCGSPHRAMLEMYRCAGKAVLIFENRDSLVMRIAVRLGLVPVYEYDAVADNGYQYGGYRNTAIPNAVYRWTEREIEKAIRSYDPAHEVPIRYFYGLRLPHHRSKTIANPALRLLFKMSLKPFSVLAKLFPSQMNEFGFFLDKGQRQYQPWVDPKTEALTRDFLRHSKKWREFVKSS